MRDQLYTDQEMIAFSTACRMYLLSAARAPLMLAKAAIESIGLLCVVYLEAHIIFRVFEYLAGDDGWWSPRTMGVSAAVVVIAFHILVEKVPGNIAVRFVNRSVQILIPIYLVGIGLFVAVMMMREEVGSIGIATTQFVGTLQNEGLPGLISNLFEQFADPAAWVMISIGIGSLAIINIFVAHNLIEWITKNTDDSFARITRAREANADYATIKHCQKAYAELRSDLADLDLWDDIYICMYIAGDVLQMIAERLLPHKKQLKELELELDQESSWTPSLNADPKLITGAIKKIEAITASDIITAMTPA